MSADQWAGLMQGDESYACAKSWFGFKSAVEEVTGFSNIIPTHQVHDHPQLYVLDVWGWFMFLSLFGSLDPQTKFLLHRHSINLEGSYAEYGAKAMAYADLRDPSGQKWVCSHFRYSLQSCLHVHACKS